MVRAAKRRPEDDFAFPDPTPGEVLTMRASFVVLGALAAACGGGSSSLCREAVDHVAPCCQLTVNQLSAAMAECDARSFTASESDSMQSVLAYSCDELFAG